MQNEGLRIIDNDHPEEIPESELLSVPQVAKILNVSRQTIYNKVYNKEIEYYKIFDTVKFDPAYIRELIRKSRIKSVHQIREGLNNGRS